MKIVENKHKKLKTDKVKNLFDIKRGKVISNKYIKDNPGCYNVYSSSTSNKGILGKISTFNISGESLTWTTDGYYAGTVFHRTGEYNCTNVCGILKQKNTQLNMKYFSYLFNSIFYKYVIKTDNRKLMSNIVENINFQYVENIKQQENIAYVLSTQEEQIERIKGLIKKLEKRNQYYAEKLLSGELRIRENKETGKNELYENEEWQDVILNNNNERCPLDWNKKIKLSNISNIINGFPFKTKDMNYEGKYPIIKMSNFKNGVVEINKLSKFTNNNMENYLIQENDLLMGLSGSVGSIAIFKLNRKAFLNQRCLIIRSNDYQDYINYCLKYLIPKYIKNNSFGGVISNLSHKEIENFELIWDNENIKVASIIKNFNEELEKVKQILIREEKRFQWMLDNLLSGEYEVVED